MLPKEPPVSDEEIEDLLRAVLPTKLCPECGRKIIADLPCPQCAEKRPKKP